MNILISLIIVIAVTWVAVKLKLTGASYAAHH